MSRFDVNDTISAIASATGSASRGIIRISGPSTFEILGRCSPNPFQTPNRPQSIDFEITLDELGRIDGQLLAWPTHKSFTREPCAEFHTVGSPVILNHVLQSLIRQGARLATHGEFTMRAFLAGRIDLTQAEAVLGVIDANSQMELETALKQLSGGLLTPLRELRDQLIHLISDIEAELDFVEEDIEFVSQEKIESQIASTLANLDSTLAKITQRANIEGSPRIVLLGPPNAGKSTLFNRICRKQSVIVSKQAGTTRDFVTGNFQINGKDFELIDTAGIQTRAIDEIDSKSQTLSWSQSDQAAVRILCLDSSQSLGESEWAWIREKHFDVIFQMKSDLGGESTYRSDVPQFSIACPPESSNENGTKNDELPSALETIFNLCEARDQSEFVPTTIARCTQSLNQSRESLVRAKSVASIDRELLAADLRQALNQLGEVVGEVYTDDILDKIFSRFCIGK